MRNVNESLYRQHEEDKSRHPQHQDLFVVFALGVQFLVIGSDQEGFQEQAQQQHGSQAEQHLSQEAQDAEAAKQQAAFQSKKRFKSVCVRGWRRLEKEHRPAQVATLCLDQSRHDGDEQSQLDVLHHQHPQEDAAVVQITCLRHARQHAA